MRPRLTVPIPTLGIVRVWLSRKRLFPTYFLKEVNFLRTAEATVGMTVQNGCQRRGATFSRADD